MWVQFFPSKALYFYTAYMCRTTAPSKFTNAQLQYDPAEGDLSPTSKPSCQTVTENMKGMFRSFKVKGKQSLRQQM